MITLLDVTNVSNHFPASLELSSTVEAGQMKAILVGNTGQILERSTMASKASAVSLSQPPSLSQARS
jgi:hypothetical protein